MDNAELQAWLLENFDIDEALVSDSHVTLITTRPGLVITDAVREVLGNRELSISMTIDNVGPGDNITGVTLDSWPL